jgi:lysophospholipase L1-like esterase
VATTPASIAKVEWLALGDSYTIGEGVDPDGRWAMQLARTLRESGIAVADPRIVATTGWTTDELAAAIEAEAVAGTFGLVSLAIGVNDQYRGRDVTTFVEGFEALLARAVAFAGGRPGRVLVLSIPDWGATAFGVASGRDLARVSRDIDAYNAAALETCARVGVAHVDVTAASREAGGDATMLAADGLHPSAAMYARWVRLAFPVARQLLSDESP